MALLVLCTVTQGERESKQDMSKDGLAREGLAISSMAISMDGRRKNDLVAGGLNKILQTKTSLIQNIRGGNRQKRTIPPFLQTILKGYNHKQILESLVQNIWRENRKKQTRASFSSDHKTEDKSLPSYRFTNR